MEKVTIDLTSLIAEKRYEEFKKAIADAQPGVTFVIEKGVYDIDMGFTQPGFYYVSNNDGGVKNIFFPIRHKKDIEIDFSGATLIFHGLIFPFVIDQSEGITLRNFSVKYSDTFYLQGKILKKEGESLTIACSNRAKYCFEGSDLILSGEGWERNFSEAVGLVQEFDGVLHRVAYRAPVLVCKFTESDKVRSSIPLALNTLLLQPAGEGMIRISGNKNDYFTEGNQLVLSVMGRETDIFLFNDSKDTVIENVNIYNGSAMGVIGQVSENITLNRVRIMREEGASDIISTLADATHFVNCSGRIVMKDCVFENMLDDATNIHGIFTGVSEILSDSEVIVTLGHEQQFGVNIYKPGDRVSILKSCTNVVKGSIIVVSSELIGENRIRLQISGDTEKLSEGDHLENDFRMPEIYISGCRTGNNRPRGFIVASSKKTVIENCVFYNSDAGVATYGDVCYWFESGRVSDVTIRNNLFLECNYQCGEACIVVKPEVECEGDGCFHKNYKVYGNRVVTNSGTILSAYGVDGVLVENNTLQWGKTYPNHKAPVVLAENCKNVTERNNRFAEEEISG